MKRQCKAWEKKFATHLSVKGLISIIYLKEKKKPSKLNSLKILN